MKTGCTLFVRLPQDDARPLPCSGILRHFGIIRDSIAETGLVKREGLFSMVSHAHFVYVFNVYKAIDLLLHERYHESAWALLRQMWEVTLNFQWICEDVEERSKDFCNFTTVERRKLVKENSPKELEAFDSCTDRFQDKFKITDKKDKFRDHFSAKNIRSCAESLSGDWLVEYEWFYDLASKHAHGSPSVILDGLFASSITEANRRDDRFVAIAAITAIDVMNRFMNMLHTTHTTPDMALYKTAYDGFKEMMSMHLGQIGADDRTEEGGRGWGGRAIENG